MPPGRFGRAARALAFGLAGSEAPLVALTGFLLRGGIVLLALPGLILPSVINIAGVTGVDVFSIAGTPTPWLIELIVLAVVVTALWLVAAGLLGSVVDVWLVVLALDPSHDRRRRLPLPPTFVLVRLAAIRMVCLLPLAIAFAWAATRIFTEAYDELTTPSNLATPLALRVVLGAGDAVAVVAAVWMATETLAAIAVRREMLAGGGILRSLGGAAVQMIRRPVSTLLTVAVTYATGAAATGLGLVAIATSFDWCRIAARNEDPIAIKLGIGQFATTRDFRPVAFVLAAVALVLAWAACLALAAVASTWRSAAFTNEVADALAVRVEPAGAAASSGGLGLSGTEGVRSGD